MSIGQRYLVDTSAWIEVLRKDGDSAIRARVKELAVDDRAVLCDMVRVELWNGARGTRDQRPARLMPRRCRLAGYAQSRSTS